MWPLNEIQQGKNLIDGNSDIKLYNVEYTVDSNFWVSRPVRFSGESDSYGMLMDSTDMAALRSFGWIGAMYREATADFPIFEWDDGLSVLTHIWIYHNALFVNLRVCAYHTLFSTVPISNHRWYILAVSYDADLMTLSVWVDGEMDQKQIPACDGNLTAPTNVWVNHR